MPGSGVSVEDVGEAVVTGREALLDGLGVGAGNPGDAVT